MDHVEHVLAYAEKIIEGAEEYLAFMSDQPVFHHLRSMKHPERLSVRLVFSRNLDREVQQNAKTIWAQSKLEIRLWQNANLGLAMNEKIAGVCFPGLDGKLDLTRMLAGKTPEFHGWCDDLFEFYWDELAEI